MYDVSLSIENINKYDIHTLSRFSCLSELLYISIFSILYLYKSIFHTNIICLYVSLYIYSYICTYIHTDMCMSVDIPYIILPMYTCIYIYIYIYIYIHIHGQILIYFSISLSLINDFLDL